MAKSLRLIKIFNEVAGYFLRITKARHSLQCLAVHDAVGDGIERQGGDAACAEFHGEVLAVRDDGGKTDAEAVGNDFVDVPHDHFTQNVLLTRRQARHLLPLSLCTSGNLHRLRLLSRCRVGGVGEAYNASDKFFLTLMHVKLMETFRKMGRFLAANKHNRAMTMGKEKGGCRKQQVGGDEEMIETLGMTLRQQLAGGRKEADLRCGHHLLNDAFETDGRQGVGLHQRDGGTENYASMPLSQPL